LHATEHRHRSMDWYMDLVHVPSSQCIGCSRRVVPHSRSLIRSGACCMRISGRGRAIGSLTMAIDMSDSQTPVVTHQHITIYKSEAHESV